MKCPTLGNILQGQICTENFAGLASTAYIFLKKDLVKPLENEGSIFYLNADSFKDGKGLFKLELKEEANNIVGESQKKRGGFKQTGTLVIEVVNSAVSELMRALNNLDWCLVIGDGEQFQIMYNKTNKMSIDAGGLKTETGSASSDDRIATLTFTLANCIYPNTFLEVEGDIEDYYVGDQYEVIPGGTGSVDETGAAGQVFFVADEPTYGSITNPQKYNEETKEWETLTTGSLVPAGTKIKLTAQASSTGKFDHWTGGNKSLTAEFVTNGNNQHIVAYFSPKQAAGGSLT